MKAGHSWMDILVFLRYIPQSPVADGSGQLVSAKRITRPAYLIFDVFGHSRASLIFEDGRSFSKFSESDDF